MIDAGTWAGLAIAATTMLLLYGFYKLLCLLAGWTLSARDALRDRYDRRHWQAHWIDLGLLPLWLALELACLVVGLAAMLVLAWAAYDSARRYRDWWHEGGPER